jgi:hypothetical protein
LISQKHFGATNEDEMRTPQKVARPPEKKPVESHSNDFFPVGSLIYRISLLRLDQVKGKLEIRTLRDVAFNENRPRFQNC